MNRPRAHHSLVAVCLALLLFAPDSTAAERSVDEIRACSEANRPEDSSEVEVVFRSRDRSDVETVLEAKMFWKDMDGQANVLLRLSAPPKYRGAAVLILERAEEERDLFMYLPELGRVKRITGSMMSGSIFGTDFSYEEFERLQGFTDDLASTRLPDAEIGGTPVYVLEHKPRNADDSGYQKTVEYIETEHCLPLKLEFFGHGDRLEKVLEANASTVEQLGERWIAKEVRISDLLDQTSTLMQLGDVEFDGNVPRKLFSTRELERSGR